MEPSQVPNFDQMPPVEGMPQGCAWGFFDKDGKQDLLGTLNLLTPSVVKGALAEGRDGVSISLNWPLNGNKLPMPGRAPPAHKVSTLTEAGVSPGCHGWDDELHFNTQGSSQWDSLVHWQHQPTGKAYNGIVPTKEGLAGPQSTGDNAMPTLDHWHARGGMVARGVLIDFKAWWEKKHSGDTFHPFGGHRITAAEMEEVARDQGVEFRGGDVLIVRTGATEVLSGPKPEDLALMQKVQLAGVHGCADTVRWLWDRHFAAVAGDSLAFEALMPVREEDGQVGGVEDLYLHAWLLSMFGMPIGEAWDLSALSRHCAATGRYSFLLTSVPMNMPGLVGSPPNALAIF